MPRLNKEQKAKKLEEIAEATGDDVFTVAVKNPELAGGLETLAKRRAAPAPRKAEKAKPSASSRGSGSILRDGDIPKFKADYRH